QRIFVSPEIAGSLEFSKKALSQPRFQEHLRMVFIDEAHCVSLWGGSFRSEYAELGVLRGRVPASVAFAIASATLPTHVLDDVRAKLKIGTDAASVSMSNARPNIALSVRKIVHPDETKADLRFLIPEDAVVAADVPISLVYFNTRIETEDACDQIQLWASDVGIDRSAIGFYHAKIGTARKRELEQKLQDGSIRILCCTDAVGMGCDMRNIFRVVLWKLPPSFCALAQRSGRAVRDFEDLGEAILFVSAKVLKDGVVAEEARLAREDAAQPHNQEGEEFQPQPEEGQDVVAGQAVVVGEGGARVEHNAEADDVDPESTAGKKKKRKAARQSASDALEADFLTRFACTTQCRRDVWDEYFNNGAKSEWPPLEYSAPPGARCCDICDPDSFPVPLFDVEKIPGLKGGKKRKFPPGLSDAIRVGLRKWSREVLMPLLYPKAAGFSMTGSALLPDSTIDQIAMCGERVATLATLQCRARWFLMPNHGQALVEELQRIFRDYDTAADDDEDPPPNTPPNTRGDMFDLILGTRGSNTRGRAARGRGGRARGSAPRGARGSASRARGGVRGSGSRARARGGNTPTTSGPPRRGRSADTVKAVITHRPRWTSKVMGYHSVWVSRAVGTISANSAGI
ncbi:P-loop containing nucleoside triphosphate hydrolase protein, partial [Mycena pura]